MKQIAIERLLEDVLHKQETLCRELLALSKSERAYIIHVQLAELEKAGEKKAWLKEEITRQESLRQELMPYFKQRFSIEQEEVQLSEIIAHVDEPHKTALKQLQVSLRELFEMIRRVHDGNRILVKRSIAFQEESFMMLYGLAKQDVRYEKNGQMTHNHKPLVDSLM